MPGKIGLPTDQRMAVLRNQASNLLWYGRIETTKGKAKELQPYVEKIITLAVNSYTDSYETTKTRIVVETSKDKKKKGVKEPKEKEVSVINDGPKKLAARRRIMSKLYDLKEIRAKGESKTAYKMRTEDIKHPLVEKLFNEIAPKYAERKESLGNGGGYTRIYLKGQRKGDGAEVAIIELV